MKLDGPKLVTAAIAGLVGLAVKLTGSPSGSTKLKATVVDAPASNVMLTGGEVKAGFWFWAWVAVLVGVGVLPIVAVEVALAVADGNRVKVGAKVKVGTKRSGVLVGGTN